MVTRGRAINLDTASGLDLVFVIDASSSVTRDGFNLSLNFAQEFVKIIGLSKRYDKVFKCKIVLHFKVRDFSLQLFIPLIKKFRKKSYNSIIARWKSVGSKCLSVFVVVVVVILRTSLYNCWSFVMRNFHCDII